MPRITFDGFAVDAPPGWSNITDTVEADDPPITLALPEGVGALQFSVALYQAGPVPDLTPEMLLGMLEEFGDKRGIGEPSAVVKDPGPPMFAAGSFLWGGDFLRVWQVSDGRNIAFVTYTCTAEHQGSELPACERIVRSIVFAGV